MSTTSPASPPAGPEPKRVKKRLYIPMILLVLVVAFAIGFFVRGTWPDTTIQNPTGPADGAITQLFRKENGNVIVRCGVVVDAPPKDVWAVVSDYSKHHEFLPYVSKVEATKQPDGKLRINGSAHSRIWGDWPFESMVSHRETPADGEYSALWSEENVGLFAVSRGGWSLSPVGTDKKQTLLVFTLQIELKDYPNFIVRNVIMDRLHTILTSMRDETLKRKKD